MIFSKRVRFYLQEGLKKNNMARPSKYNKKLQKKFDTLVDTWNVKEYFKYGDVNQIALYLGIVRETVYDWREKIDEFSDTFKRWETKGKAFLFEMSPKLAFKCPAYAIFLMKVKLKYIEIDKHEHEIKGGISMSVGVQELRDKGLSKKELMTLRDMVGPRVN